MVEYARIACRDALPPSPPRPYPRQPHTNTGNSLRANDRCHASLCGRSASHRLLLGSMLLGSGMMELTEASSWLIGNCHMKGLVKSGSVDGVWSLTEVGYAKRKWLLRLSPRQARANSEPTRSHLKPWGNRRIHRCSEHRVECGQPTVCPWIMRRRRLGSRCIGHFSIAAQASTPSGRWRSRGLAIDRTRHRSRPVTFGAISHRWCCQREAADADAAIIKLAFATNASVVGATRQPSVT